MGWRGDEGKKKEEGEVDGGLVVMVVVVYEFTVCD